MMYYAIDWYDEDDDRNIVVKGTVVAQGKRYKEIWDKLVAEHTACYISPISEEQFREHIYPFG